MAGLNRAGLGPLHADISAPELRRAGLPRSGPRCDRLDVHARHVIFGHTHRAGPLPDDDRLEWRAPTGAELINSGCWVYEPAHVGSAPSTSPYRPGFAVAVGDEGAPRLSNLLDGVVGSAELAPTPARA